MKKAVILGPRRAGLVDSPQPKPTGNLVVVKVRAIPMCTEYKQFVEGKPADYLGHEAAGEVVETAQPGRVKVGDRVVVMPQYPCGECELCMAGDYIHCEHLVDVAALTGARHGTATYVQYLLKADWLLPRIPEGVSYEHASMACCGLGPTFGAMERMNVTALDTVLITGVGPVGLGGVINARCRGATVIVVEGSPYRADLARRLGAQFVFDPADADVVKKIRQASAGRGPNKAVDCSGVPAAHRLCLDALCRRGQLAFVGETYAYGPTPIAVSPDLIRKGLTLHGCWHYNLAGAAALLRVIVASAAQFDLLITHRLGLSEVQQALELSASGQCGKIVLDPWR